jgi:hypothetical protein
MPRVHFVMLLLIGLALRCGHTHTVSRQDGKSADTQKNQRQEKATSGEAAGGKSREHEREEGVKGEASQAKNAAPPLANSPEGLLQPGTVTALQDKLVSRGYLDKSARSDKLDGKTEKALREFQRDQGLPATGAPDDLTVQKLGLSPRDVFRRSSEGGGTP